MRLANADYTYKPDAEALEAYEAWKRCVPSEDGQRPSLAHEQQQLLLLPVACRASGRGRGSHPQ